jgi:hypothetical protein
VSWRKKKSGIILASRTSCRRQERWCISGDKH